MFTPKWCKPVKINEVITLCDFRPKSPPAARPKAKTAKTAK